jgi:WD40 repeat protein
MREIDTNEDDARLNPTSDAALETALETAIRAIRAQEIPTDRVMGVRERARALASNQPPMIPAQVPAPVPGHAKESAMIGGHRKRYRMVSWILSLAAMLTISIGLLSLLAPPSVASSFARMLQKAKEAKTVQGLVKTRIGESPLIEGKMYLEPNKIRQELMNGNMVFIFDLKENKRLFLNRPEKVWQTDAPEGGVPQGLIDPIGQLAHAKPEGAKLLGEEMLGKVRTRVYQVSPVQLFGIKGDGSMTVWVDESTGLPTQLVIKDTDPKHESEIRLEQLVWNQPLEANLFSLETPKDYKPGQIINSPPKPIKLRAGTMPKLLGDNLHGLEFSRAIARILWNQANEVTVLLRDPEKSKPGDYQPFELIQVDLTTGRKIWGHWVLGTSTLVASPSTGKLFTVIGREIQVRNSATGNTESTLVNPSIAGTWAVSPDGMMLVTGIAEWKRKDGPQGGFRLWDLTKKAIVQTGTDQMPTTHTAFAPDGKSFVISSNSGPVRQYDATSGKLVRDFPGTRGDFSPDGNIIALASVDRSLVKEATSVDLYRTSTGEKIRTLTSNKGPGPSTVLGIAFSPDGKRIAAVDWNGEVRVWDVATGQMDPTRRSHKGGVLSVSFSPDGNKIASGSEDGTLRLWTLGK